MNDSSEWDGAERRTRDVGWHVGKEIPLALLAALVIQTGGGIWWASTLSSDVAYIKDTLRRYENERYTREDARRDRELLQSLIDAQRQRDNDHDRRLAAIEAKEARERGR